MPKGLGKTTIKYVLDEFKRGQLKSGSGKKVTNRKQALAIAINESKPQVQRKMRGR